MIAVRLPQELENRLNILSKSLNKTKTDVVKEALLLYFKTQEQNPKSPYELGKELFGKYSSNEKDLSTTYKKRIKEKINAKYSTNR